MNVLYYLPSVKKEDKKPHFVHCNKSKLTDSVLDQHIQKNQFVWNVEMSLFHIIEILIKMSVIKQANQVNFPREG